MSTPTTTTAGEYLLLFRGREWYNDLSAEELQKALGQTKAWFERVSSQVKVKASQPLAREGATVSVKNGRVVTDGPYAESKEAIGGYLLFEAGSLEEAIALAKTCPTLAYDCAVEVRPVGTECPMSARARQLEQAQELVNA